MKSLLICPTAPGSSATVEILGRPLICYWIEHLAETGVDDITILAFDGPELVRAAVGDGTTWGIKIELLALREPITVAQARSQYVTAAEPWLTAPYDVIEVVSLPNSSPKNIFADAEAYFTGTRCWMPHALKNRVGIKETAPGIWVSIRSHVSAKASLKAPCWIEANVLIEEGAVIGPMAVLERNVVVAKGAIVANSVVQANTYVGELTNVQNSIVNGSRLLNWKTGSTVEVRDDFLIAPLRAGRRPENLAAKLIGRSAAFAVWSAAALIASPYVGCCRLSGARPFTKRLALTSGGTPIEYYEFTVATGYLARWPQLWNIVRGEFRWFGNRPVAPQEFATFDSDFEKLWLESPIGLFSHADASGCWSTKAEEAKAHACFYSVRRNWKFNLAIFTSVCRNWRKASRYESSTLEPSPIRERLFAWRKVVSDFLSL